MMGCGLSGLGKGHGQAYFSVFIETAFSVGVFEASSSGGQNAYFFQQSTLRAYRIPIRCSKIVL